MKRNLIFYPFFTAFLLLLQLNILSQPVNLILNPGFEGIALERWSVVDSCRFEITPMASNSGQHALAFYPAAEGAGLRYDLSGVAKPGYLYAFSGFLRTVSAGWGQADVLLTCRKNGSMEQVVIGRADCNEKGWTSLSGQVFIPGGADPSGLHIVIKTAWGETAFLADDLVLRPALQVQVQRAAPADMPAIVCQAGPSDTARQNLPVQVQLFDSRNHLIRQFTTNPDIPVPLKPDAGFYRIHAGFTDTDGKYFMTEKPLYAGDIDEMIRSLQQEAGVILGSGTLHRYHGWIRYLGFLCSRDQTQAGPVADNTLWSYLRLDEWCRKIAGDRGVFDSLSGVIEWAYLSQADNTGQPFKLAIPDGYRSGKPYPLVVVMHGHGGNHMEYSGGVTSNPAYFELHVLGRARGGGYTDLSEADVLDAVDFVRQNWNIDDRRIHLTGASMGGGGTFRLAARYPHLWASGRPVCGYGPYLPAANMLHVPFYSTHSQDDPTVPVLASRAILQKLNALGGQVIIDETTGLQHAAWNFTEGNNRAQEWFMQQVCPEPGEVKHIDFTATDRKACSAYWLSIAEWGDEPGPARFRASVNGNQLYLDLNNIATLQISMAQSPFDREKDIQISVNEGLAFFMKAPLPDTVYVHSSDGRWFAQADMPDPPSFILHTPGGASNLYGHEPMLIVWGTGGDASANALMAEAAEAARAKVNIVWAGDDGQGRDGVPHNRLLYGKLNAKPDTAVTEEDLKNYHLVLFGTAGENALVRKIQPKLPVRYDAGQIICSDGVAISRDHVMTGLYFHNPLSPRRLIYWIAADKPTAYRSGYPLFMMWRETLCATDFIAVRDDGMALVKLRHFNSRWDWSGAYEKTTLIPAGDIGYDQLFRQTADAMRSISGSDFALHGLPVEPRMPAGVPGTTRWADIAALYMATPVAVMQMKGDLILSHKKGFAANHNGLIFFPDPDENTIDPGKTYQVALSADFYTMNRLINQQMHVPDSFEITGNTIFDAMRRFLF